MNAITFSFVTPAALRTGTARWRGRAQSGVVTTAVVVLAAVVGFVGSVAWAS